MKKDGTLEFSLATVPMPEPEPEEVIVRIEASPLNPSDQGLLFGGADLTTAKASGTRDRPVVTAVVPPAVLKAMAGRLDQPMPVGNEGAGVVVKAGASSAAQALLGKTVAILGGAMYAQYRAMKASHCLLLPSGTTPAEGVSCWARHVCDMSSPAFIDELTDAIAATGATIAFDAVGRRAARGTDPHRDGGGGDPNGEGVQPIRIDHAQAGLAAPRAEGASGASRPS